MTPIQKVDMPKTEIRNDMDILLGYYSSCCSLKLYDLHNIIFA